MLANRMTHDRGREEIAFLTTIYPACLQYVGEFADSLRAQSDSDFRLLVGLDGVEEADLRTPLRGLDWHPVIAGSTFAETRRNLIYAAAESGAWACILGDADDYFSLNRVETMRRRLEKSRLIFNELIAFGGPVDPPRALLAPRLGQSSVIDRRYLLNQNCMGLSNTAAHTDILVEAARGLSSDSPVVDWPLFYRAVCSAGNAALDSQACTHYRQHGSNLSTLLRSDPEAIAASVRVKAAFYEAVSDMGTEERALATEFQQLGDELRQASHLASHPYVLACQRKLPEHPLWWEIALRPSEL